MTMWIPQIGTIEGPRYLAVVSAIVKAIDSGQLPPGAQLPPQRELADRLRLTVGTISRAYSIVKQRNLVSGEVGRGTFVAGPRTAANDADAHPRTSPDVRHVDLACFRAPLVELAEPIAAVLLDLAARANLLHLDKYPPQEGFPTHRTAGATWLAAAGLKVDPESVIVTAGAQPALAATLAVLAPHGTTVLTESLTYSGMKVLASACNIALRGVAMDAQGMVPEALEERCAMPGPKVLYVQPTLHNPTTRTMDDDRRRRIVAIARKHDLYVIEDDAACSGVALRLAPIATLAPERTVYITSLSKSVSPALRIGFMTAPQPLADALLAALHGLAMMPSSLMAHAAAALISNGDAFRVAAGNLKECARRHDIAVRRLAGFAMESHPSAFYLLLGLPPRWRVDEFCAKAKDVTVVPVDSYAVAPDTAQPAVRVSLNAALDDEMFERGLARLRTVLSSRPYLPVPVV